MLSHRLGSFNVSAFQIGKLNPPGEGECVSWSWLASGVIAPVWLGWWGLVWEVGLCLGVSLTWG